MGPRVYLHWGDRGHRRDPKTAGKLPSIVLFYQESQIFCQLELTLDEVKWAIVAAKKLKIKHDVSIQFSLKLVLTSRILVYYCYPPSQSITNIYRWT